MTAPSPDLFPSLEGLSPATRDRLLDQLHAFCLLATERGLNIPSDNEFQTVLLRVWEASPFVAQHMQQDPALLSGWLERGELHRAYASGELRQKLVGQLATITTDTQLATCLRQFRREQMVRIAWRDLASWSDLAETLSELSELADCCVSLALDLLHDWHVKQWGDPRSAKGKRQRLVVIGMGKLGAHELNFSSDIDLIFAFPEDGTTRGGRRIENDQFFTHLGRRLIKVLDEVTAEGMVFRVDMRLRPYGDSGPLALSFDALEEYYQTQAREWERYAWVKARPIAGDLKAGAALLAMLRPFVYRRYLDFGSFDALRSMKAMIMREVERKGMDDNIKLGAGGIREVEFIAQAFQLIRGGRDPDLQDRRLLPTLRMLADKQLLPEYVVTDLIDAYTLLRRVENRLQAYQDRQVHQLPRDEQQRLLLGRNLGYSSWDHFIKVLNLHRAVVSRHFDRVFEVPKSEPNQESLHALWAEGVESQQLTLLAAAGYGEDADCAEALKLIADFRDGYTVRSLSQRGVVLLEQLMPLLIAAAGLAECSVALLSSLLTILERIGGRMAYLSLLVENPMALSQLVKLCGASPWVVNQLSRYPILLDELLDPGVLYAPQTREGLSAELEALTRHLDIDDLEQQMEALRVFSHAAKLRLAAADISAVIDVEQVSEGLSTIAELVVDKAVELVRRQFEQRYGSPTTGKGKNKHPLGFGVIAYGKLGGRELSYSSDLDLVFLHETYAEDCHTPGPDKISCGVYFARLGQRVIHVLSTLTLTGSLYEIDMRLRPNGASGVLVADLEGFEAYQYDDAWTWEHQALVRARFVAGDQSVGDAFVKIRCRVLSQPRKKKALRAEISTMRGRMRDEFMSTKKGVFDLKQGPGGIADIEFMIQYAVLLSANKYSQLCDATGNLPLMSMLREVGVMQKRQADTLAKAYLSARGQVHRLALLERPALLDDVALPDYCVAAEQVWNKTMIGTE